MLEVTGQHRHGRSGWPGCQCSSSGVAGHGHGDVDEAVEELGPLTSQILQTALEVPEMTMAGFSAA